MINKYINKVLEYFGVQIIRNEKIRTCVKRLKLAKNLGFNPKVILDGGAFHGLWTKEISILFTETTILLVEPNPFIQNIIKKNIENIYPKPVLINAALGCKKGKSTLNIWRNIESDVGASLLENVSGDPEKKVNVKVETIDNLCKNLDVTPDLIKLDLQGNEYEALLGAENILATTELVIIEFGLLDAYKNRSTPRDIINLMYDYNYVLYDIVDCNNRPYDNALCGGDFFFVKQNSILKNYKGWE
jgi:FkbM family methyltransferase